MDFEEVWNLYPEKSGRKAAERHFKTSVKSPEDFALLKRALNNYLYSERVRSGFVQNGSTWFNNWEDWVSPTPIMMGRRQYQAAPQEDFREKWKGMGLSTCHGAATFEDEGTKRCELCRMSQ